MTRTSLLTLASSAAAFILGFQMFQEEAVPASSHDNVVSSMAVTNHSTQPFAAPSPKNAPNLPIPLHFLETAEFESFDQELNLTSEARHLLAITPQEAEAVVNAAITLRDSIEHAQSQSAQILYQHPATSITGFILEVNPLGPRLAEFNNHYRTQIQQALGPQRADFIAVPIEIDPEQGFLYTCAIGAPGRYCETTLVWSEADGAMIGHQSRTTSRLPGYVKKFFGVKE